MNRSIAVLTAAALAGCGAEEEPRQPFEGRQCFPRVECVDVTAPEAGFLEVSGLISLGVNDCIKDPNYVFQAAAAPLDEGNVPEGSSSVNPDFGDFANVRADLLNVDTVTNVPAFISLRIPAADSSGAALIFQKTHQQSDLACTNVARHRRQGHNVDTVVVDVQTCDHCIQTGECDGFSSDPVEDDIAKNTCICERHPGNEYDINFGYRPDVPAPDRNSCEDVPSQPEAQVSKPARRTLMAVLAREEQRNGFRQFVRKKGGRRNG